jgi:hypothetical protein
MTTAWWEAVMRTAIVDALRCSLAPTRTAQKVEDQSKIRMTLTDSRFQPTTARVEKSQNIARTTGTREMQKAIGRPAEAN